MKSFEQKWQESHAFVDFAQWWLREHFGWYTNRPDQKLRPDYSQRRKYRDSGDLTYKGSVIEVKSKRNVFFTSPVDFPFGTIMVEDVKAYRDPRLTMIVSGDMKGLAIIPSRLKSRFFVRSFGDKNLPGVTKDKYLVGIYDVQFWLSDGTLTHEGDRPICLKCRKCIMDQRQTDTGAKQWVRLRRVVSPKPTSLHICDHCDDGTLEGYTQASRSPEEGRTDRRSEGRRDHQEADLFGAVHNHGHTGLSEAGGATTE